MLEDATISYAIERIMRDDSGRLLASLIAHLRDFQLAEDSLQDALESALVHWERNGLPPSPAGWLMQAARHKAIDRLRRAANFQSKQAEYAHLLELDNMQEPEETPEISDERLRLIFTCCHPALDSQTRVALTLRTLGGLTTEEIAKAFVVSKDAMAQRLVRARHKISKAGIPYQVPEPEEWAERLDGVLAVIYLIFNAGYSGSGQSYIRVDLCDEAIRLCTLVDQLRAREPEVEGLLALMVLHHARRAARVGADSEIVALEAQDRGLWDRSAIKKGAALVETALQRKQPGAYQLQAAIAAIHAEASSQAAVDWAQIVLLYSVLEAIQPNPIFALNRIVALSYARDAHLALTALAPLTHQLAGYQPFYAVQADLLMRVGRPDDARVAFEQAISLSDSAAEQRFLRRRMNAMGA